MGLQNVLKKLAPWKRLLAVSILLMIASLVEVDSSTNP
jgi:hypothetical protein